MSAVWIVYGWNDADLNSVEVSNNDVLCMLLQLFVRIHRFPVVRVHRFHFRKDLGKFVEEVIDGKEALKEIETIGTDFTVY